MKYLITIIALMVGIWMMAHIYKAAKPSANQPAPIVAKVNSQVVELALGQFHEAVKNKDLTEICLHAGVVATAYKEANDETKYQEWKKVEQTSCDIQRKAMEVKFEE